MEPLPHQLQKAEEVFKLLQQLGYAYLAGKPRSGKTYTAILAMEKSDRISKVLVLTKKNAIPGWNKFIAGNTRLKHKYLVTNYEQIGSIKLVNGKEVYQLKVNGEAFQAVIIDESHNTGAFPKPSNRYKLIRRLCWNLPHLHLSGTAIIESMAGIFHQMQISKYCPFRHKNFYDFHKEWGMPYHIKAAGREITQYDRMKPELLDEINKFTVYMTQEDAGISVDLQAVDQLHYVTLKEPTMALYNQLQRDKIVKVRPYMLLEYIPGTKIRIHQGNTNTQIVMQGRAHGKSYMAAIMTADIDLVCDTVMKERVALHMLESGVAKIDDEYIDLGNNEKIDYIKQTFGDTIDTGIMCHFVGERIKLEKEFKYAKIYSSSSHAEGVDLSHLKNFVILSSDYSGAKFVQRRERIINISGSNTLTVHHILVRGAVSEQVYKRVSKKEDFNNSTYERRSL